MSAFGDAAAVAPEVNYTLMATGDLGSSLVAAAAGYETVADMLMAELSAMGINTSTTATVGWQGPGGVMMQMSAAEFMAVCAAASAWARVGQVQAGEVAAAHSLALDSMIPAEVALTNRITQAGLVASNLLGQNTPAIVALDGQYYGEFWVQNATARTAYGSVVSSALGVLAEPAPFSPTATNPAGPAVAVAQDAATQGGQTALQASAKTMTETAHAPVDAAATPEAAQSMISQLGGQMGGLVGQMGSGVGQVTQMGQQLPQMLGQAPQMLSGMLGPLTSAQGLDAAATTGMTPALAPAGGIGAMPSAAGVGGLGALGGIGGAGGGVGGIGAGGVGSFGAGSSALSSSFVRPASSFSTPNSPTLPAGWLAGSEPSGAQSRPLGGGGGMYGAPPGVGARESQSGQADKPARTLQLTARTGDTRGDR